MICYRDMTYCGSKVHKPDCERQFTEADKIAAEKWWSSFKSDDPIPVAFANFCDEAARGEA